MPYPTEIYPVLVLAFQDLDDLGVAIDALDEGIFDGFAELLGEGQEGGGVEVFLVAEEDDEVVKEGLADGGDGGVVEGGEVDVVDFGADGTGDFPNLH